jgi:hypothetical protein
VPGPPVAGLRSCPCTPVFDGSTIVDTDDVNRLPIGSFTAVTSSAPSDPRDGSILYSEEVFDDNLLVLKGRVVGPYDVGESVDASDRPCSEPLVVQVVLGDNRGGP